MRRLAAALLLGFVLLAPAGADGLRRLPGTELADAATGFVRQAMSDPHAVVVCDATIPDQQIPSGQVRLTAHWTGTPPDLRGRVVVPVAILVDGQRVREIGVPCRVQAAAVSEAVRKGDPVTVVLCGNGGALRMEIPATAHEGGAVGATVKVELTATHKLLAGQVTAAHQVVVP